MSKRLFLIIALLPGLFITGCNREDGPPADPVPTAKFVNTEEGTADGAVLVLLGKGSKAEDIEGVAGRFGAAVSRVFPPVEGKEEAERAHRLDRWYRVSFDESISKTTVAEALASLDKVESVEYDKLTEIASDGKVTRMGDFGTMAGTRDGIEWNDPYLKLQWNLSNNGNKASFGSKTVEGADMNVRDAWRLCAGDPSIVVAVIDYGVKYTHPDLAANMWVNKAELNGKDGVDDDGNGYVDDVYGYNFADKTGDITWIGDSESVSHGTHVAGLVAAVNNNGTGISSVAGGSGNGDGVRIMSCQVMSSGKDGGSSAWAEALRYAANSGASVAQCSFGYNSGFYKSDEMFGRGTGSIVIDAIEYFLEPGDSRLCNSGVLTDGNIVVFSAGNDGKDMASYPGAYYKNICVTAFSQDFLPAWYTNYGYGCNIAAPGGDNNIGKTILSTVPSENAGGDDYAYMHGTSQATPQVSGAVALGLSYAKKLGLRFTREEFTSMVLSSVGDLDSRLTGTKNSGTHTMYLDSYRGKMGTGNADVWKLMMQIEGTPCVTVPYGKRTSISLDSFFGDGSERLTYLGAEVSQTDRDALGLNADPAIEDGKLVLDCSRMGSGKITVRAIAGGDRLGGDETGGMEISKTVSVISRSVVSENGGWL